MTERDACGAMRRLDAPWTEDMLTQALAAIADDFGFNYWAVLAMPSTDEGGATMQYVFGNWPKPFERAYEARGLHRFSLVMRALKADPMPFVWDAATLYGTDEAEPSPAARLLIDNDYLAGAIFPVWGLTTFNGAVSFAGRSCDLSEAEVRELHLACFAFFGMLAAARFIENQRRNPLTTRERDCLKLAMLGKTSSEIGAILSLSEHTVSQYLTSATRKMNASNRTHAVALAAQSGYLS